MTSHIDIKRGLRLLIVISLLAFAHKGMAVEYMYTGEGGGVPPAAVPPTSATMSNSSIPPASSSSVPKLDADPYCNNNPCLKAAEPSVYRPGETWNSGSNADAKRAEDVTKDILLDEVGKKVSPVGGSIYKVVTSPIIGTLEVIGAISATVATGAGIVLMDGGLGDGTLPLELQQGNAKNAAENADKQRRIDSFNNLQQSNIEEMKKAEAEATKQKFEAAKQQYEAQQASKSVFDAVNSYVNTALQIQQIKQQTSAPAGSAYSGPPACPPGYRAIGNYCMPPAGCTLGVDKRNPRCER